MRGTKRMARMPRSILRPMLATLVDAPFDDPAFVFETKWDGFRVVAQVGDGMARLLSRNGNNVTDAYPRIAKALSAIRHSAVIDGELVALDNQVARGFNCCRKHGENPAAGCVIVSST